MAVLEIAIQVLLKENKYSMEDNKTIATTV